MAMPYDTTRRRFVKGAIASGFVLTAAGPASAEGDARYIARVTGSANAADVEGAGFTVERELAGGDVMLVTGPDGGRETLADVRGVQAAVVDIKLEATRPVEPEVAESLDPELVFGDNQWDNEVENTPAAHDTATGDGRTIAIVDSGIDDAHPDLGNVDVEASVSVVGGAIEPHVGDIDTHGTHVGGIAAATGDHGVVGVAPDADLVSVRVFEEDEEGGLVASFGDILLATEYAAGVGADSANLSIGTAPIPPNANAEQYRRVMEPVIQSVTRRGTLVVVSAGNSAANLQQGGFFTLPNSLAGAVSIGATSPDDERSYYSNYGTNEIDLAAPGGAYNSLRDTLVGYQEWLDAGAPPLISLDPREEGEPGTLWLDEDGVPTTDPDAIAETETHPMPAWPFPFNLVFSAVPGGYGWAAGTSMAAPQVAGAAALVREVEPSSNARQVETALKRGADLVTGRNDPEFGAGRLDVLEALDP